MKKPLYRPANFATYKQGQRQVEQAQALFTTASQDLVIRVSTAYFDVLAAQDTLTFVQAQKSGRTKVLVLCIITAGLGAGLGFAGGGISERNKAADAAVVGAAELTTKVEATTKKANELADVLKAAKEKLDQLDEKVRFLRGNDPEGELILVSPKWILAKSDLSRITQAALQSDPEVQAAENALRARGLIR